MAGGAEAALNIIMRLKDQASSNLKGLTGNLDAMMKKLDKVGTAMSIGVTLPLLALGRSAKEAASDLNESVNKVNVVFGQSAVAIQSWSKTSARAFGMSRQAALEATGTFGNLFTSLGLGQKPILDMSKGLVELAADLASFNNIDPTQTLNDLRSGMIGQMEPMLKYGVILSANAVKLKATQLGLLEVGGELTAAAAAQARYAIILEQTRLAQGDFARTSGDLANATRISEAAFTDAKAALGEALLPIILDATKKATDLATAFTNLDKPTRDLTVGLLALAAAAGPLEKVLSLLIKIGGVAVAAIGGAATIALAAAGALAVGLNMLDAQYRAKSTAEWNAYFSAQRARLADLQRQIADTSWMAKWPGGAEAAQARLFLLKGEAERLKTMLSMMGESGQDALHKIVAGAPGAAAALDNVADAAGRIIKMTANMSTLAGPKMGFLPTDPGKLWEPETFNWGKFWQGPGKTVENWIDSLPFTLENSATKAVKLGSAMSDSARAAKAAWDSTMSSITSKLDAAIAAATGLFDVSGGDKLKPGANGPFENIFRLADVAKLGAGSPWAEGLGKTQEEAVRILADFQNGLLTAEVTALIDVAQLADMAKMEAAATAMKAAFVAKVAALANVPPTVAASIMPPSFATEIATTATTGFTALQTTLPPVVQGVAASIAPVLAGIVTDAYEAGRQFCLNLAAGIEAETEAVLAAARKLAEALAAILPHSNAKKGPLASLTASGRSIPRTLATGIRQGAGALTASLREVLAGLTLPGAQDAGALTASLREVLAGLPPRGAQDTNSPTGGRLSAPALAANLVGGGQAVATRPPLIVNFNYAPTVSMADAREAEEVLAPMLARVLAREARRG